MLRDRFSRPLEGGAEAFTASVAEDEILLPYDILGSLAHARMLREQKLISASDGTALLRGLAELLKEARTGEFRLDPALEDVHMNVEAALTARLGEAGRRLHTGRSRNDQVAIDLALFLRDQLAALEAGTLDVVEALLRHASSPAGKTVIPAATHFQDAQRVYLGQHLLVHAHRFLRDSERFRESRRRLTVSPLGAGAVAGSSLPLDSFRTARLLGFERPHSNSIDAVSDRDAPVSTLFALSLQAVHISSLAEELVVWSTPQLGRVRLGDGFVTTSSLMPHKRNPDVAELLRAQSGPFLGLLVAHLTLLKGLPLAYNRDLQAGKPLLFEGVARARTALGVLASLLDEAVFLEPTPGLGPQSPTWSVELVDALVRSGTPFREAHSQVARFLRDLDHDGHGHFPSPDEVVARFPLLKGTDWKVPAPAEEPDLRTTFGGSSWPQVAGDLAACRRCARTHRLELAAVNRAWRSHLSALLRGTGTSVPWPWDRAPP